MFCQLNNPPPPPPHTHTRLITSPHTHTHTHTRLTTSPTHTQVLIQLGYEPTPPQRRYSFFFRQYLYYYPGIYGYAKNIVQKDGWKALYRGLGVSLFSSVVGISAHALIHPMVTQAVTNLPVYTVSEATSSDVPDTEPQEIETTRAVLVQATRSFVIGLITSVSVEMIVRPFNMIAIRSIAQHVGKESMYNGVFSSIRQIYNDEGLTGFYAGLAPAILGHAFSCIIYSSMWIAFEMIAINCPYRWMKLFIRGLVAVPLLAYIPRTYSYPFSLMTNMMAVNKTQLQVAAGQPGYCSWRDCYRDLKSTGSLYRGSVVLFPRFAYKELPTTS